MNLINATVLSVIDIRYDDYGSGNYYWFVDVVCIDEGGQSKSTIMCKTKEEAESIGPGYRFLH